jgi:hypothetical protein
MPMNPRLLRPTQGGFSSPDADARAYLAAVRQADGANLEPAVAKAISDFVIGCKTDGIWDAIKASCILAGARTLSGALIPLKGSAPTNNGPFVSGDYNRKTGLKGNGTNKDLAFPFDGSTVGQDNYHLGVYAHESATSAAVYAAHGRAETGATNIAGPANTANNFFVRCRNSSAVNNVGSLTYPGYVGVFRTGSATFVLRTSGTSNTFSRTSETPPTAGTSLFNHSTGASLYSNVRLSFFSSGEYIDPATLESRVNALIAAIGAAIP